MILLANKACMRRAYIIGNAEEKAGTGSKESSSLCEDRHRLCVRRDEHLVGILAFWEEWGGKQASERIPLYLVTLWSIPHQAQRHPVLLEDNSLERTKGGQFPWFSVELISTQPQACLWSLLWWPLALSINTQESIISMVVLQLYMKLWKHNNILYGTKCWKPHETY